MVTREQAVEMLRKGVGRSDIDFRDGQWEAIDGVLNHRRQLVVQRTGWGKSMIYFLAAKFLNSLINQLIGIYLAALTTLVLKKGEERL